MSELGVLHEYITPKTLYIATLHCFERIKNGNSFTETIDEVYSKFKKCNWDKSILRMTVNNYCKEENIEFTDSEEVVFHRHDYGCSLTLYGDGRVNVTLRKPRYEDACGTPIEMQSSLREAEILCRRYLTNKEFEKIDFIKKDKQTMEEFWKVLPKVSEKNFVDETELNMPEADRLGIIDADSGLLRMHDIGMISFKEIYEIRKAINLGMCPFSVEEFRSEEFKERFERLKEEQHIKNKTKVAKQKKKREEDFQYLVDNISEFDTLRDYTDSRKVLRSTAINQIKRYLKSEYHIEDDEFRHMENKELWKLFKYKLNKKHLDEIVVECCNI